MLAPVPPGMPVQELDAGPIPFKSEKPGGTIRSSWVAMGLVAAMLLVIAFLLLLQRGRANETALMSSSTTAAAAMAPAAPVLGEYRFMDIPWGTLARGGPHEARGTRLDVDRARRGWR